MASHHRRQQFSCFIILTISSTNVMDVWSILGEQLSHATCILESFLVYISFAVIVTMRIRSQVCSMTEGIS